MTEPVYVAIVGSRDYPDLEEVRAYVRSLPGYTVVVSGGARGVDLAAEGEARRLGLEVLIYRANWTKFGKRAGFMRNKSIVTVADRVVAFWDGRSRGTAHAMDLACKMKVPLEVRRPER